jgi:tetratricopeptide (TPR) repeat protein
MLGGSSPVEGYKISVGKKEEEFLSQATRSNSVGVELYKAKNYTKAIEEYTKAIDLINTLPDSNPDKARMKASCLFNRARAFDNKGKLKLAIDDYQAVIALNSTHAKALDYLKQCLEKVKK